MARALYFFATTFLLHPHLWSDPEEELQNDKSACIRKDGDRHLVAATTGTVIWFHRTNHRVRLHSFFRSTIGQCEDAIGTGACRAILDTAQGFGPHFDRVLLSASMSTGICTEFTTTFNTVHSGESSVALRRFILLSYSPEEKDETNSCTSLLENIDLGSCRVLTQFAGRVRDTSEF